MIVALIQSLKQKTGKLDTVEPVHEQMKKPVMQLVGDHLNNFLMQSRRTYSRVPLIFDCKFACLHL